MDILKFIAGIFTGTAGATVGNAVSVGAQVAAVLAALVPAGMWLTANKDAVFITLTYGDLAFWGTVFGGQLLLVVRLVHRAAPPA